MSGWLERVQKRKRELADGADADLLQANRNRFRLGMGLFGFALLLGALDARLRLPITIDRVVRVIAGISGAVGLVLCKWASQERAFLMRPDSEGPPEIFRNSP